MNGVLWRWDLITYHKRISNSRAKKKLIKMCVEMIWYRISFFYGCSRKMNRMRWKFRSIKEDYYRLWALMMVLMSSSSPECRWSSLKGKWFRLIWKVNQEGMQGENFKLVEKYQKIESELFLQKRSFLIFIFAKSFKFCHRINFQCRNVNKRELKVSLAL